MYIYYDKFVHLAALDSIKEELAFVSKMLMKSQAAYKGNMKRA